MFLERELFQTILKGFSEQAALRYNQYLSGLSLNNSTQQVPVVNNLTKTLLQSKTEKNIFTRDAPNTGTQPNYPAFLISRIRPDRNQLAKKSVCFAGNEIFNLQTLQFSPNRHKCFKKNSVLLKKSQMFFKYSKHFRIGII